MKGNKTEMYHWTFRGGENCSHFFSFFEQYQSEYHCYSKCLALFCLEALDLQTSAVSDARRPVKSAGELSERWGGWGGVASTECLSLLWSLLGVKRQPHSAALPPGLHLTLPQSGKDFKKNKKNKKSGSSKTDRPITALSPATHGISNERGGPPPLDPGCRPALSPISQFFDTKITLAGRCNSHISGIFASVLFFFFFQCIILFVYMQWSTKYWLLN